MLAEGLAAETNVPSMSSLGDDAMDAVRARLAYRSAGTTSAEFIVGETVSNIAAHASRLNADLIVMGTNGRSGIAHLLLGSVAEHVVRTAPCPVVTVRHTAN